MQMLFAAMPTQVLLTSHHPQAMENACDRGFWMPVPIPMERLQTLLYLVSISEADTAIHSLAEITSFEPWRSKAGQEFWLPFLGRLLPLPRPVPLGDRHRLADWLPQQSDQVYLIDLLPVLEADQLSDLACGRPGRGSARGPGRVPRRSGRAARVHQPCGRAH